MIRAWRYVEGTVGREAIDPERLEEMVDLKSACVWVDCAAPSTEEVATLRAQLAMSPTVVEAILNPEQRTKLLRYGDYFHVAIHDCELSADDFQSREIDIVTGPGWLVTVRHPTSGSDSFDIDEVAHRFELQRSEHSTTEQGFLLWALFDLVVDRYFEVTDAFDDRLDTIEEGVFGDDGRVGIPREVFSVRRELMLFRRAAAPVREVVNAIIRKEIPFVGEPAEVHFHDIYDRILRVVDLVESQRDLLTGLLEADLAVISNRLNEVMKKMTSWGAILIVATLIAGIYGMNFRHMPELHWQYGYLMALGMMGVSTFVLYRMFKRRDWL
ncbi:MAG: magnesium/cobalt transporter CorA [Acidimicrobiia bacterium]